MLFAEAKALKGAREDVGSGTHEAQMSAKLGFQDEEIADRA